MSAENKIFCIGLSRTGTTSFHDLMSKIGFRSVHYPNTIQLFGGAYDTASDIPVVNHYKELDKMFPKSKFIYTVRQNWIDAVEPYFLRKKGRNYSGETLQTRLNVYGSIDYNRTKYENAYNKHDEDVRKYFQNRPDDLLVLDIIGGDKPEKLYEFLAMSADNKPAEFPHSNKLPKRK